jgi:capsular polysaccharide biosynthesis protein
MREQITETKMHALDYWQVIRNRWGVILLTFFLITLASLVIIASLDKKFAGRTKFQVLQSSARTSTDAQWRPSRNEIRQLAGDTVQDHDFEGVAHSRREEPRSHDRVEYDEDEAANKLERMIETEQERGTEIIAITVWSTKGDEAARIADGVREGLRSTAA